MKTLPYTEPKQERSWLSKIVVHKSLPLSMGRLIDDNIQCGYHGMTFNPEGYCVRIPGQESIPRSAVIKAFPVQEKNDIVWIWMGHPEKADEKEIFHLEEFDNSGWKSHQGDALYFQSNYLNVAENLVDPAHVSFVHPTTLGNPESEDVTVRTDVSGEVLVAWRWIRDAPPVGFLSRLGISQAMLTDGITTIFTCQALQ